MKEVPPERAIERQRLRAARASLVFGVLIGIGKFVTFGVTGSSAVLSDAMESLVNIAASALMLTSVTVAALPADRNHPYGHGKIEFLSAGAEGALIAVAGLLIVGQACFELWVGPEVRQIGMGLWLLGGVTGCNAVLGLYLIRVGRRTHSVALEADGHHLLADVFTSVGVLVGLAAVWATGWMVIDPLIAIAVAVHVFYTGWRIVREAIGGLMDETDPEMLAKVAGELERQREPWLIDIHTLRLRRSGVDYYTDFHVAIPRYFDADRLHAIHDQLCDLINEATGRGSRGDVIVHFDPCRSRQCEECAVMSCALRQRPFVQRNVLTVARVTREDEILDTGQPVGEPKA